MADSRRPGQNRDVAHSIFTKKFSSTGDAYDRILEMPTYGQSDNHVGLQLADLLCSALLFPLATLAYCTGYVTSVHVDGRYSQLKDRYGGRLKRLQYIYSEAGRARGGITVCDGLAHRGPRSLFI